MPRVQHHERPEHTRLEICQPGGGMIQCVHAQQGLTWLVQGAPVVAGWTDLGGLRACRLLQSGLTWSGAGLVA